MKTIPFISRLMKNGKPEKAMEIIRQGRNLASDSPLLLFLEGLDSFRWFIAAYCQYHYFHKEDKALDVHIEQAFHFIARRNVLPSRHDSRKRRSLPSSPVSCIRSDWLAEETKRDRRQSSSFWSVRVCCSLRTTITSASSAPNRSIAAISIRNA